MINNINCFFNMTHYNFQPFLFPPPFNESNLLLTLHLIKKQIQENLIREINVNFQLKQRLNLLTRAETVQQTSQQPQSQEESLYSISSSFDSEETTRKRCNRKIKKSKNDTKNVPKNFGKAIINFVQQKEEITKRMLKITGKDYISFLKSLKSKKKYLNSIAELRGLWLEESFEYAKEMRSLSLFFLKKVSLGYIFGSRISHYQCHIKYRNRLIQALKSPHEFTFIKS